MSELPFNIRHGQFHDVVGISKQYEDITFVPARITLNFNSSGLPRETSIALQDSLADAPAATKAIVHLGEDAPWVLGRLIRLFGTEQIPEEDRGEKSCFYAAFLAVLHSQDYLAIPFEVSDHYGRSRLTFSTEDAPDAEKEEYIAKTFWKLLLSEPTDLAEYNDKMYHSGAGIWIRFGVEDGEPFMVEEED